MITEMAITDLMHKVHYSCDTGRLVDPSDWLTMIACKVSDPVIPALIDEIQTNGFQDPITLNPCPSGDGYHTGNGHHRLSVMILLGADTILVEIVTATVFGPNSTNHTYEVDRNPCYNDGDQHWLAEQVLTDAYGDRIYFDSITDDRCPYDPIPDSDDYDCDDVSESSDSDATQPYGTWLVIGPGNKVYVDDHDVMIHSQGVVIPVEIIGQLALL